VRFRSSRGREGCRERAEREGQRRPKPSPSTPAPAAFVELSSPGNGWGSSVGCSGWRGEGLGEEWHPGERFGRFRGFYTPAVDSVRRGFDRLGLGSGAVLSGRCSGLGSVVCMWSSGACCANGQMHGFSRHARFLCHGRKDQVVGRAGQGWRVVRASMPCRCTCDAQGKGACMLRNGYAAPGV
jgi:hypothetical protein